MLALPGDRSASCDHAALLYEYAPRDRAVRHRRHSSGRNPASAQSLDTEDRDRFYVIVPRSCRDTPLGLADLAAIFAASIATAS
jgi:hypothetical protein